jgi:hypothetical protein
MTITAKKPRKPVPRMSEKKLAQLQAAGVSRPFSTVTGPKQKIAKVGKAKPGKVARNKAYYASPEWRAKKKAVHERDGYQCVEMVPVYAMALWDGNPGRVVGNIRCPNRGEIVNHKQTARGLVAEETSYFHRGVEGSIDKIKTRCKDCDRRLTPLERANHAQGFNGSRAFALGTEEP